MVSAERRVRTSDRSAAWLSWGDAGFLLAGVALLAVLLWQLGAGAVASHLRVVGWGIVLIVAQEVLAYSANTLGWYAAFRPPRPRVAARRWLAARIAGDAINYLTPTAGLGGEFVRARYLRDAATPTALAASVTIAKLSQFVGQLVFVSIGLLVVLPSTPLPLDLRLPLAIGLVLVLAAVFGLVVGQRHGLFGPTLRLLRRLGVVRERQALAERLARLDAEISRYHLDGHGAFAWSVLAFAIGWALGLVEVALMLWLLDVPVTWQIVLAIEVLSIVFDALFFFVPAKAGTQEAGKVVIFATLGLDPGKGLALGLLRRMRELIWAAVGVSLLWLARRG